MVRARMLPLPVFHIKMSHLNWFRHPIITNKDLKLYSAWCDQWVCVSVCV